MRRGARLTLSQVMDTKGNGSSSAFAPSTVEGLRRDVVANLMSMERSTVRLAPQVGLEPIRLRFATDGVDSVAKLRRDRAEARRGRETGPQAGEGGHPQVNRRVETAICSDQTSSVLTAH